MNTRLAEVRIAYICGYEKQAQRISFFCLLAVFLSFSGLASAQVQPGFPTPQFNPQDCQFGVCVDLANNNVTLSAPIRQKNGAFPFRADFVGNYYEGVVSASGPAGLTWQPSLVNTGGQPQAMVNDFINSTYQIVPQTSQPSVTCSSGSGTTTKYWNWLVVDAGETVRFLGGGYTDKTSSGTSCLTGSGFTSTTTDGSGITVTLAPNGTVTSVYGRDGASFTGNPFTKVQDAYGNSVYQSGTAFHDTLGVDALDFSSGTSLIGPFTWKDVTGNTQTVTVGTTSEALMTNFGCSTINEYIAGTYTNVPTRITFADGTEESWTYNQTYGRTGVIDGRLSEVTLPTGGTVTFTYATGYPGINCSTYLSDNITKTLGNGDTTTYALSYASGNTINTVVDPGGNKTVYTYIGTLITEIARYSGASTLLDVSYYCYNTTFAMCVSKGITSTNSQTTAIIMLPIVSG